MRQKDVNWLADRWADDLRDASPEELVGYEMAIGAVLRPLQKGIDPRANLDLTPLVRLIDQCKAEVVSRTSGQPPSWHVENNMTGARASRDFTTIELANGACRSLNLLAGPGGLYGVYDHTGAREMSG